jgi:flagellar export protein FliJ
MKRFLFGLQEVLELRMFTLKSAEARLAEKSGACARIRLGLEENAMHTLAAAKERFRMGDGAAEYRAGELYSWRLSAERERLFKALALAEAEREKARLVYVDASKSKELVAKLREREEKAYYKALMREETNIMDDLAAGAHARSMSQALETN